MKEWKMVVHLLNKRQSQSKKKNLEMHPMLVQSQTQKQSQNLKLAWDTDLLGASPYA